MAHNSFLKKNKNKLKELANTFNPSAAGTLSRFVFHRETSNSNDGVKEDNNYHNKNQTVSKVSNKTTEKKATSSVAKKPTNSGNSNNVTSKGRLFSYLSQSKFSQ